MKKIAVITSTRAEFGLLAPLIQVLKEQESDAFSVELVVTGTHLSKDYGYTIDEILQVGFTVNEIVSIPLLSHTALDISKNQAETLTSFTKLFMEKNYSGIVLLGDRYEMLAIAIAAGNTQTAIFHLCGGDTTEGAMDEWIRHSITKMSYLHFPSNPISYKRILQLGEEPKRVFNYGSTSIDNINSLANMSKKEALNTVGLEDDTYAICTYHPVTMGNDTVDWAIQEFLGAIKSYPQIQFIITKSNADQGGAKINALLDEAEKQIHNLHVFSSLGVRRYLSLMKGAEFVLGNSSSGIIEAPALKVPTVNIGDRQRGRLQSESIINCEADKESICRAIDKVRSPEFQQICKSLVSCYGDGHAAEKIGKKIVEVALEDKIDLKKKFYNIEVEG